MRIMYKRFFALALLGIFTFGCEGAYRPAKIPGADVENTETFVLFTKKLKGQVTVEGQRAKWTGANLLEVQARIRNRTEKPLQVEVQTVFKDDQGFSVNDTSAWKRLIFEPNETKIYRVNSINSKARNFTIRVREF
jgi:uncharacterized protein YcfL